jgi:hypothetical protein
MQRGLSQPIPEEIVKTEILLFFFIASSYIP